MSRGVSSGDWHRGYGLTDAETKQGTQGLTEAGDLNPNLPLPRIFPQGTGDHPPSVQVRGARPRQKTPVPTWQALCSVGLGGARAAMGGAGAAVSVAVPLLTLLSTARITRQHASTGPTPLSARETVVRPLEPSAHRLWLGEMPGSWAGKSTLAS